MIARGLAATWMVLQVLQVRGGCVLVVCRLCAGCACEKASGEGVAGSALVARDLAAT